METLDKVLECHSKLIKFKLLEVLANRKAKNKE
jgi:hypothetical protein